MTRRATVLGLAAGLAAPALARVPAAGGLDGADFEGVLAPADGGQGIPDSLHFREGYYWSRGCIACSFAPGIYWTRKVGKATAFTGVLKSPERGSFKYEGLVEGDQIDVTLYWERARWYWTLKRDFRFTGTRMAPGATTPDLEGAFIRAGQPRAPQCTL